MPPPASPLKKEAGQLLSRLFAAQQADTFLHAQLAEADALKDLQAVRLAMRWCSILWLVWRRVFKVLSSQHAQAAGHAAE